MRIQLVVAVVVIWVGVVSVPAFSQIPGSEPVDDFVDAARSERLALAESNPAYPVTPGDTYELSFTSAGQLTRTLVTVESDGTLNLNIFGSIDTSGMTYTEVKRSVEATVQNAYPRSLPSFRLIAVGLFEIPVRGAVAASTRVTAWGLSSLGEMIQPLLEPYSSTRRVVVRRSDGTDQIYDVFRGLITGDREENPYMRPGQSVRVLPVGAQVTINGEVNRPGRYEISPGETLADVVRFAGGFSPEADTATIRVSRVQDGRTSTRTHSLEPTESEGPELREGDRISVETILRRRSFVFVEGALTADERPELERQTIEFVEDDAEDVELGYVRVAEPHYEGLLLSDLLSSLRDRLDTFADLRRTHVIRGEDGEIIEVDVSLLLYGYGREDDLELMAFDTVFIPSRRVSVLVSGPVAEPGLYLYVPGQSAEYYIHRAGGYDREISATGKYIVLDSSGRERAPGSKVQPGDRIEVERNNFVYQFNRHFPVIVSGLGIITTVISVLTLISQ